MTTTTIPAIPKYVRATLYPGLDGADNAVFGGGVKYYPPAGYTKCRRGTASTLAVDADGKILFHVVPSDKLVQVKISAGTPSIITDDTPVGPLDDIINFSCMGDALDYIDMVNDPDSGYFD